jgi:hypothetical protein
MKKFLVLYLAPARVIDEWMKTAPEKRKADEEKMQADWKEWVTDHAKMFVDMGGGVGKTKRVTAQGVSDTRNDIMLYAIANAESHEAAAKSFEGIRILESRKPPSRSWRFAHFPGRLRRHQGTA